MAIIVSVVVVVACGGWVAYFPEQAGGFFRSVIDLGSAAAGGGSHPSDTTDRVRTTADLKVGMCLTLAPSTKDEQTFADLPVVDCAEAHASEVVGVFAMPKGKYPDSSGFDRAATDKCFDLVRDYVGTVTPELAKLQVSYIAPMSEQWSLGNRVVACIAAYPSGKHKGSIKA